ncbi:hypothetical protein O2W15_11665 [Modestobacter sp. VKM Ac-2979]|uniref:hypothetical protein n=1 Tax=unclassified Modestobacter TaxID=2643866 RepID=UPI0022AB8E30|nr:MULTISPECIES: hypothetical protein [unclassified Modestobacter]MCZ2812092.1 hypothetical protein [Modestobacter sp. VKM Ac-2979]MCZ2843816.1 hypothetical protein [Modestobacter sp. VKM Ac-2980]
MDKGQQIPWSGVGVALGTGVGLAVGVAVAGGTGIPVGLALGAGLGVVVGAAADGFRRRAQR